MADQFSIAETRDHLTRILRGVERGDPVEITRWGRPVAVLVSMGEYERLLNGRRSFWSALTEFRDEVDLADLEGVLEGLRDGTPAREVRL